MSQYEPLYDSFNNRSIAERYVPTARMSVSASVYLPGSEVDLYTGQLKPDRQRRRRTQGKRLEAELLEREQQKLQESIRREMSKGGVRVSLRAGILVTAFLLFICGISILYQHGQIAQKQSQVNTLKKAIIECQKVNAVLEEEILIASSEEKVCYSASQNLGMRPASSMEAIHLVAVDTRPMETARIAAQQAAAAQLSAQTQTASLEVQTTQVPMLASN